MVDISNGDSIRYNGQSSHKFVMQRTAAYVDQVNKRGWHEFPMLCTLVKFSNIHLLCLVWLRRWLIMGYTSLYGAVANLHLECHIGSMISECDYIGCQC